MKMCLFLPMVSESRVLEGRKVRNMSPNLLFPRQQLHNNLVQHGRGLISQNTFYVLRDQPHSATVLYRKEVRQQAELVRLNE